MTRMRSYNIRPPIKSLSSRRRHLGLKGRDRMVLLQLQVIIHILFREYKARKLLEYAFSAIERIRKLIIKCCVFYDYILEPPKELNQRLPRIISESRTIDSFADEDIPANFRFRDKEQLRTLFRCFQLPDHIISASGHVFNSEELLLVTLFRLHAPGVATDLTFKRIFGWPEWKVYKGFNLLINYILDRWSYLVEDNILYWKNSFAYFADCILIKLGSYGCKFPPPLSPNGFNVFGFIDNTIYATSRPGGGPSEDGPGARRYHPLLQRSFYNGWKSVHGIKWQTIGLPNGMLFHVWGPVSCRHNDNYTLNHSEIINQIKEIQAHDVIKYVIYGDSAYWCDDFIKSRHRDNLTERLVLENDTMSKCRQAVEWDYGLIGSLWKKILFKRTLKLREQSVAKITLFAMLMTNAYVCMNVSQTSMYFNCMPPRIDDWTKNGPRKATVVNVLEE